MPQPEIKICPYCGRELDPKFIWHLCSKQPPEINGAVRQILNEAIDAIVAAAFKAQTCGHANNPQWNDAVNLLDEFTDEMRALEQQL